MEGFVACVSFGNVICDHERRKKTKEKMLNVLTDRTGASPLELDMINLKTCKDNEKSNVSFDINDSNGNSILPEMNEMQPIRKIESHVSVLRRLVEVNLSKVISMGSAIWGPHIVK